MKLYSLNELIATYGLSDPQVRILLSSEIYQIPENKSKIAFRRVSPEEVKAIVNLENYKE